MRINSLGFYAHWVDAGRKQAQVNGYAQLGALDSISFQLANAMCGNTLSHPAIELMGGNIDIVFEHACYICISGANAHIRVNGQDVALLNVVHICPNDRLQIANLQAGWVNYIACSLCFDLPLYYHSVSGSKREKIGGVHKDGTGLKVGDSFRPKTNKQINDTSSQLNMLSSSDVPPILRSFNSRLLDKPKAHTVTLPMHFCYQADYFSPAQRALFLSSDYTVTHEADRMGLRLKGQELICKIRNLTSQPVALGAIQIAGNGQAIIMRNDRQTIGGYPIIGTVSKLGLALLAQCTSGQQIQFSEQAIADSVFKAANIQNALLSVRSKAITPYNIRD